MIDVGNEYVVFYMSCTLPLAIRSHKVCGTRCRCENQEYAVEITLIRSQYLQIFFKMLQLNFARDYLLESLNLLLLMLFL